MNQLTVTQIDKNNKTKTQPINLNWSENIPVQNLLDVIVSIIADEYIHVAKENPEIFLNNGGRK